MAERLGNEARFPNERGQLRVAAGRRGRASIMLLAAAGLALLAAPASWNAPLLLVWNLSSSAPTGLYRLRPGEPHRSDMVIARLPEPIRSLAAERRYLPANVPLVKRVAAVRGDCLCARGAIVSVNGRPVARRRAKDRAGRPMPWWSGCRTLGPFDYFLLNDHEASFDGRYFGVVNRRQLVGRADRIWPGPAGPIHG